MDELSQKKKRRTFRAVVLILLSALGALFAFGKVAEVRGLLRVPVLLPMKHVSSTIPGFFRASGTWQGVTGELGWPLQTTSISCMQTEKICVESTAMVVGSELLTLDVDIVDITMWTSRKIEYQTETPCVLFLVAIDRTSGTIIKTRVKKKTTDQLCGDLDESFTLALVDGFKLSHKMRMGY